ncbi:RidA family protein [Amycolatopsis pithecellobii]|uniref:RidA family protein n=1 Tax=Amycolatopsis pithecellobii TaxID=664692 RepID=UPI0028AB5626|nr:RidA family protein [Amycolatopsis pithecellobii]
MLDAAGATAEDVVSVTVHLADGADFERMNALYRDYFTGLTPPAPRSPPGCGPVSGSKSPRRRSSPEQCESGA